MELLLHPPDDASRHRPDARGRLSTIGHAAVFRALARVARQAGISLHGHRRHVSRRRRPCRQHARHRRRLDRSPRLARRPDAAGRLSTCARLAACMAPRVERPRRGRRGCGGGFLDGTSSPFSVAFQNARKVRIEGIAATVPRLEDYVVLKLLAAAAERRRTARDLTDIQYRVRGLPAGPSPVPDRLACSPARPVRRPRPTAARSRRAAASGAAPGLRASRVCDGQAPLPADEPRAVVERLAALRRLEHHLAALTGGGVDDDAHRDDPRGAGYVLSRPIAMKRTALPLPAFSETFSMPLIGAPVVSR